MIHYYFTVALIWLADPTPTPTPEVAPPDDLVTPGVWGFIITFGVALITVFLLIDMTRRMRRLRYRAAVREQLLAEQIDADAADGPDGPAGPRSTASPAGLPGEPTTPKAE